MKTIIEAQENVKRLLGKQTVNNQEYRLMKYVLKIKCEEGILLYNGITGQLVLVDKEDCVSEYKNGIGGVNDKLIEDYYYVPDTYDEKSTVDNLRIIMRKLFTPKGINGYTILTTTNCNARCFYCYQSGYKHINMTDAMADKLVKYIISHKGDGSININWFGGEPLLGRRQIDYICAKLNENGISYTSKMISNGLLFSESIVKKAVRDWNVRHVQITLDGTENVYNKTKAFSSSIESPFYTVLNNIRLLMDNEVYVSIRLNLDQHNVEDLILLIDELGTELEGYHNFGVYVYTIEKNEGYDPIDRNDEIESSLLNHQIKLNSHLEKKNMFRNNQKMSPLSLYSCMADNTRTQVVYPDGRLFKCEHTAEGDEIGTIGTDEINKKNILKFREQMHYDRCYTCPIYPTCILLKECDGKSRFTSELCNYNVRKKIRSIKAAYSQNRSGII